MREAQEKVSPAFSMAVGSKGRAPDGRSPDYLHSSIFTLYKDCTGTGATLFAA